jgi:hypothetical protein
MPQSFLGGIIKMVVNMKTDLKIANVIEINHGKPMVSSLTIAEIFGRPHKNVIRTIKTVFAQKSGGSFGNGQKFDRMDEILVGNIKWDTYEKRGKNYELALLPEREALIIMPFIGGREAHKGQRKLVEAYLFYRDNFSNPPRKSIMEEKRHAHHPMMDALIEYRQDQKKETESKHFICENKLCNFIVTNEFKAIDEKILSNDDAIFLSQVRRRNESFIMAGLDYADRKKRLIEFGIKYRTKLIS